MRRHISMIVLLALLFTGMHGNARAATDYTPMPQFDTALLYGDVEAVTLVGSGGNPDQNCTDQTSDSNDTNQGILTQIEQYLKQIVDQSMINLFNAINTNITPIVSAAITLMIVIFGVMFMIGMVQLTYGQALIRLMKITIVLGVTGLFGWAFFQENVVCFFVGGADDIIRFIISKTMGANQNPNVQMVQGLCGMQSPVFARLDEIAAQIIRPETIAKILAALTTGPYGLAMGGLMMIASVAFIKLLVDALKSYAISYVARALLFGLAPIFFVFLLFEKTKNYFTTWLNGIVSFTLQPVLLFIMLAFMMDLIDQAAKDMLGVEVCWAEFQSTEGSASKMQFWRFAKNGEVDPSEYDWQGQVSCKLNGGANCGKPFPIDIVDILAFVFLIFLASRFANVIERITSQLSNILISLDQTGRLEQFFQKQNQAAARAVTNIGNSATTTREP